MLETPVKPSCRSRGGGRSAAGVKACESGGRVCLAPVPVRPRGRDPPVRPRSSTARATPRDALRPGPPQVPVLLDTSVSCPEGVDEIVADDDVSWQLARVSTGLARTPRVRWEASRIDPRESGRGYGGVEGRFFQEVSRDRPRSASVGAFVPLATVFVRAPPVLPLSRFRAWRDGWGSPSALRAPGGGRVFELCYP